MAAKPIRELLPELRKARGWSQLTLSHYAHAIDSYGTSMNLISKIERGERRASARTIIALAEALGVSPLEFAEYRLAIARLVLDEERVGIDAALEALEASQLEPVEISAEEIKRHSHQRRRAVTKNNPKTKPN